MIPGISQSISDFLFKGGQSCAGQYRINFNSAKHAEQANRQTSAKINAKKTQKKGIKIFDINFRLIYCKLFY